MVAYLPLALLLPALPAAFAVVVIWSVLVSRSVLPLLFRQRSPSDECAATTTRYVCLRSCLHASGAPRLGNATRTHSRHSILFSYVDSSGFLNLERSFVPDSLFFLLYVCVQQLPALAVSPDSFGSPNSCVQTGFFGYLFQGHSLNTKICPLGG